MFITPAFAETATGAAVAVDSSAGFIGALQSSQVLPLGLVFVVFYLMVIRPQNKRAQEHRSMIAALKAGDKVITGGGLIATVSDVVNDSEVVLELAKGVQVRALRSTILTKKD